MGFFKESTLRSAQPESSIAQCGACGLYRDCRSPKMPVAGEGRRGILLVGEAPGAEEDKHNEPFIGKAGAYLREAIPHDLNRECWITNSLICRPPGNRTPAPKEIVYCRPNLLRTIRELQPRVIVLLGQAAVRSLIGYLWKEAPGAMGRWVGWRIPSQQLNCWVCPTWHPSYVMREDRPVLSLWWKRHLAAAFALKSTPWSEPPDYASQVQMLLEPTRAAQALREMVEKGGMVALDYECDRLKPDHPEARILSCAVCWRGERTIAYPWHGDAIKATGELLRSSLPKIAANGKFEERWTKREFGHGIRNFHWDTMLAAHGIDNRSDITSVKFQSFVLLGEPPYADIVKDYMRTKSGNDRNRLHEIALRQLLKYNGLDAILEYWIAQKQMEMLR